MFTFCRKSDLVIKVQIHSSSDTIVGLQTVLKWDKQGIFIRVVFKAKMPISEGIKSVLILYTAFVLSHLLSAF